MMKRPRNKWQSAGYVALILFVLTVVFVMPKSAIAGTGSIDTAAKTVDLFLLFNYEETEANVQQTGTGSPNWYTVFNEASKLLWNATNGQLRIGKVTVYLRAYDKKDSSDIWISRGSGGAYATGIAVMGQNGQRMQFYQNTHRSLTGYKGQFSIVHEMGHYIFGLYDQYLGAYVTYAKKNNWTNADLRGWTSNNRNVFSISRTSEDACIMDGGGGVSPSNKRTEFDTAGNTNKGQRSGNRWYMTKQWIKYQESCWETMGKFKWNGTTVFPTVPTGNSATAMPAGYVDIDWEVVETVSRLVLCIDESGSMSGDRIELAKLGASTFVSLTEEQHQFVIYAGTADEETVTIEGDRLGVVSFQSGASTRYALTEVTGAPIRQAARNAIAAIAAGGGTSIEAGLTQSLGLITGAGDPVSREVVILLSDGQSGYPTAAENNAINRGVRVYSIGVGSGADTSLLSSVASRTGGKYYYAANALSLLPIYTEIYADLKGGGLLDAITSLIREQENTTEEVYIDELTEEVTFVLTSPDNGWTFSIRDPDGNLYTGTDLANGVVFEDNGTTLHYRVSVPTPGTWELIVEAPNTATDSTYQYTLMVSASSPTVSVTTESDQSEYTYPERVLVKCTVIADDPVAGAQVTAVVEGPNGKEYQMTLYDDGDAAHGDDEADDGVYSNYFDFYLADGDYTFNVLVVNVDGVQGIAAPEDTDTEFDPQPIVPFTRESSFTVNVDSVPPTDDDLLRVDALSIRNNGNGTSNVNIAMTINTIYSDSFDPTLDDITLTIGGSAVGVVSADDLTQMGTGVYRILEDTIRGTITTQIGGSGTTEATFRFNNVNTGNFFTTPLNVRLQWGGFDETVPLILANIVGNNSASYLGRKDDVNTQALYIDSVIAKVYKTFTNRDTLRFVASFHGGGQNYNPATDALTLNVGTANLNIAAGSLKANNAGTVASGIIPIPGSGGVAYVRVDLDRGTITFNGFNLDLEGLLTDFVRCRLALGNFDRSNFIPLDEQDNSFYTLYVYN